MPFVTFWEQPTKLIAALRKWVEKDIGRDIHDVLRVTFDQEAIPQNAPLVFLLQFAECQYTLKWEPVTERLEVERIEQV